MLKRLLIAVVALVLLLGAAVIAFSVLRRGGTEPSGTAPSDGLPAAGEREAPTASPTTPSVSAACPEAWPGLPDGDSDGLPDDIEARYHTNEAVADTDGDGHSDRDEVAGGYDPVKKEGNPRLDSDGDGLLEHEECQWKTDPFTADTDGDGFRDGEEVRNEFDPTVRGNGQGNDALPARRARVAQAAIEQFRPNSQSENLTERLAAQLFGDRPIEELEAFSPPPEIIQRALDRLPKDTELPDVPLGEFVVTQTNTPADIQRYLAALRQAEPLAVDPQTLSSALNGALGGNAAHLAQIRTGLERYEQDLRSAPVPPSAVNYHRRLFGFVRFTIARYRTIEELATADPVRAYLALRELEEGARRHVDTLVSLRDDLERLAAGSPQ